MADNELRYDRMVEDALRSVVSRALSHAAERGLSGDHHFYITFLTDHPGVAMPDHLRGHYPSEMTIVLQHQFWGLEVGPEAFGVTLSFANEPERLTVPFAAVTAFADPSVRFGLQFDVGTGALKPGEDDQVVRADLPPSDVEAANLRPLAQESDAGAEAESGQSPPASDSDRRSDSDKVVTLDAFRKVDDRHKT
ncbi:MAG: SspB family protein [Alphaproteobacteria bacterium]